MKEGHSRDLCINGTKKRASAKKREGDETKKLTDEGKILGPEKRSETPEIKLRKNKKGLYVIAESAVLSAFA